MKFLDRLSEAYYQGNPLVSNEYFDELAKKYNYNKLGTESEQEITHAYRMYSLKKIYVGEPVPFEGGVKTPKLDGAAVAVYYKNGNLVWAATRGNGIKGQDITDKMIHLGISRIAENFTGQITGEVVTQLGQENLRNYASGALNLKNLEEFKSRELYFVGYDAQPNDFIYYMDTLEYIRHSLGIPTVLDHFPLSLPTDGWVFRVNSNKEYEKLGFTSKHPRGAYALKENKAPIKTRLLDIEWNTNRTGVVSPVAILEPVDIDGAKVSRATLHNWAYIEKLGLYPNCEVGVIRSGDIIPRIVEKYD